MSVTCSENQIFPDESTKNRLFRKAAEQGVPISGSMELTQRCNFRCVHCYLGASGGAEPGRLAGLGTADVLSAIDGAAEGGCLYLLLTGGEALLRDDFAEIYRFARNRGMLVTVFSNGTLISEEHVALFKEFPPHAVEITLYGMTEETYERVTRVKGAYARVLGGIERLRINGIPFRLKTVLLTLNKDEVSQMREFAEQMGVNFRLDSSIFPTLGGDRSPLEFRVTPAEAVKQEFADRSILDKWKELIHRCGPGPEDDQIFGCGAGRTAFAIDAAGILQPCIMSRMAGVNVSVAGFGEAWKAARSWVASRKRSRAHPCGACTKKLLCGYCPPFSKLETGSFEEAVGFLCELGHARHEMIYNYTRSEQEMIKVRHG